MPVAALPGYFPQDQIELASPGLRFGMYLRLWGVDHKVGSRSWATEDIEYRVRGPESAEQATRVNNKASALAEAARLTSSDRERMKALRVRQAAIFNAATAAEGRFSVDAVAVAPFSTGLGIEHPLENGFAFLNPYGLPYLPGSGVKGVLRAAARELAEGRWGSDRGWTEAAIEQLFGPAPGRGDHATAMRGALQFWDVFPELPGDRLMVEVMTPHQGHYYGEKTDARSGNSASPHDSGQPTPLTFLTVPPEAKFAFHVHCDLPLLLRRTGNPAAQHAAEHWHVLLKSAFEHAFDWLGFGAKTAVGYGAMGRDEAAERARAEQIERIQREQERQKRLEAAVEGLPPDAAELKRLALEQGWESDHGALVSGLGAWLERYSHPSPEAVRIARDALERAFKGLLADPDATQGKKNKPKFKDTQRKLAHAILRLEAGSH